MIEGYYYLHTNGSLIYKVGTECVADIRDSDFARCLWPCDPTDRAGAWMMLSEALAIGANPARVNELAGKWGCDDKDAERFAQYICVTLEMDGGAWCAKFENFTCLQESPAGFGDSALEAFASLCKAANVHRGKLWGATFADIAKQNRKGVPA